MAKNQEVQVSETGSQSPLDVGTMRNAVMGAGFNGGLKVIQTALDKAARKRGETVDCPCIGLAYDVRDVPEPARTAAFRSAVIAAQTKARSMLAGDKDGKGAKAPDVVKSWLQTVRMGDLGTRASAIGDSMPPEHRAEYEALRAAQSEANKNMREFIARVLPGKEGEESAA